MEPAAAARAAQQHKAEDIKLLRQAVGEMGAACSDRRLFAEADLRFHLLVSAASGNPLFRSFAGVIETAPSATFSLSSPTDEQESEKIVQRHATIVTAIEAGDSEGAAQAMLRVIDEGVARVV